MDPLDPAPPCEVQGHARLLVDLRAVAAGRAAVLHPVEGIDHIEICALAAIHRIGTGPADQRIVARPAEQAVIATDTCQPVIARAAVKLILTRAPE